MRRDGWGVKRSFFSKRVNKRSRFVWGSVKEGIGCWERLRRMDAAVVETFLFSDKTKPIPWLPNFFGGRTLWWERGRKANGVVKRAHSPPPTPILKGYKNGEFASVCEKEISVFFMLFFIPSPL